MKVIVTGGAGYIGSHTVAALHAAGHEPVIVDNFSNSLPSVIKALEKITGSKPKLHTTDITDVAALQAVFESEKPDAVIHFAAKKAVGESVEKPLFYYQQNIVGLLNVLQVMQDTHCQKLVFSSSCTVYGEPEECPVTEQTPQLSAASPYGATKQMAERILQDMATAGLTQTIALRYFNPVGAHSSALIGELPLGEPNNLIPLLTQAAAGKRKELTVYGDDYDTPDGTCVRDFVHVMDLAEAHVAALTFLSKSEEMFTALNVGTGKGNSVKELIDTFEKETGVPVPHRIGPRRPGDIVRIWADTAESQKQLHWQASRSLSDAMVDAWRWQQQLDKDS